MLKKLITGVAVTTALFMTGCTYKSSNQLATIDLNKVDMSKISQMKRGEACHSWFLFFPTGTDTTTRQAAQNAGISHIEYVEHTSHSYLIGGSNCTVVYGE